MKAVAIILSIVAFVACLLIGMQAGLQSNSQPQIKPSNTPNLWLSPSQQRTVAYILADNLQSNAPRLIGVWFALYRPDLPKVTLIPLYPPNPANRASAGLDLSSSFKLTKEKTPDQEFVTAMKGFHAQWNGYILTDLEGVSRTVDWMQGIETSQGKMDGATAFTILTQSWDDPSGALQGQVLLLSGACASIAKLSIEANWSGLAGALSPDHMRTDLPLDMMITDWKALVSASDPLSCEIPVQN